MNIPSYFRKRVLGNLVDHGYLEKSGNGRSSFFKTDHDYVDLE